MSDLNCARCGCSSRDALGRCYICGMDLDAQKRVNEKYKPKADWEKQYENSIKMINKLEAALQEARTALEFYGDWKGYDEAVGLDGGDIANEALTKIKEILGEAA